MLFVIIDALKVEDVILLGAAGRTLRAITTNESRVCAEIADRGLRRGTVGLDRAASLASLG